MDADRDKLDEAQGRQDVSSKHAEEVEAESKRLGAVLDKQAHQRQHERETTKAEQDLADAKQQPSEHKEQPPS